MNFARRISDQVIYFEGGHAVEAGTAQEVFGSPKQPETRAFMQSFHEEDLTEPVETNNGADPKLNVSTGTRGSLAQEE
jgi:ABC-type methionine transport system ATPase subunit